MVQLSDECRLAFCVGAGGVGKTTFAAALGISEAVRGRSVLVLTADPARRLADALAVSSLRDEPSKVRLENPDPGGSLRAAMLETKASADRIIRRVAYDAARAGRVLTNRIYRAFSTTLARSHAYAVMERVHEAVHDADYDLVIVDTPPVQSAVELLDAPHRLSDFLDQRMVRGFASAADDRASLHMGGLTQRLLRSIAGDSLVGALTEFLGEMGFLREGFSVRAREVEEIMRGSETSFALVCSAEPGGVKAGSWVADQLEERGLSVDSVVFNRAFLPEFRGQVVRAPDSDADYPVELVGLVPKLNDIYESLATEQHGRDERLRSFLDRPHKPANAWRLPETMRALGSTEALAQWISMAERVERER